jgi:hypothetical protein
MGYRIRVLGTKHVPIPLIELRELARPALLEADDGADENWEAFKLIHSDGTPIAFIEKNPAVQGELGGEELMEFVDEVSYYKPESAAKWLESFLPSVKVIYSFQLLSGTDVQDGFDTMHRVYDSVWRYAGGILQADQEGFTNEKGRTILWEFNDHVTGLWDMGVLDPNNDWIHFEMDLGNEDHRQSFWRGEVPVGAKLLYEN